MKKIVMIGIRHHVDDDRIFYKVSRSLEKFGYKVYIIGLPPLNRVIGGENENINFILVSGGYLKRFIMTLMYLLKLDADIYHFHDMESLPIALIIKLLKPSSKIIWDVAEYYPDMISMSNFFGKLFLFFMCNVVDPIVSKFLASIIITSDLNIYKRYVKFNSNVFIVPNYVEFESLDVRDGSKFITYSTTGNHERYHLIYVGGVSKDRGIEFLCKLAETGKWRIGVAGPIRDNISRKILLEKKCRVRYLGVVPHYSVPSLLRSSYIGVIPLKEIPKYQKNVPIKLFEYLYHGLPIISTRLLATCEYVSSTNSGLCVEYGNIEEFEKAIISIFSKYPEYRRNAFKVSRKLYQWRYCEKRLKIIYKLLFQR